MVQYLIIAVLVIWSAVVVLRKYFQNSKFSLFFTLSILRKARLGNFGKMA